MTRRAHDDSTRLSSQFGRDEKGLRAARSTDVYMHKDGTKEVSYCRKCGIIYRNKRWYMDEAELERVRSDPGATKVVCPSCLRIHDNNPGGIITLSGEYLVRHEEEILDLIKRKEALYRAKNPLSRIMEINQDGNVLTIATTEEKLAEKIGRDVYRAHKGDLHYQWSQNESFVRVNWAR
ncbi:MAG TPA: BCAM0308 family protein [Geobacteraceae bacterium]|nr:BCAM0308 family protein [Geobacteraceae bacterium]